MSYGSVVHVEAQARQQAKEAALRANELACRKASEERHAIRDWVARVIPGSVRPGWGPDPLLVGRAMTLLYAAGRQGATLNAGELRAHVAEHFPQYAEEATS